MKEVASVSEIKSDTRRIIESLYNNGDLDLGALASLRHSNSITSRNAAKVLPIIFSKINDYSLSTNGIPTRDENAIFTALHCYAIYQQGNRDTCVYAPFKKSENKDKGIRFCSALASLRQDNNIREALDRRMQVILTANNFSSVNNTIVQLLQILKGHNRLLKIDFADLAGDLYIMQFNNESARQICLKWGEQYYWTNVDNKEKK